MRIITKNDTRKKPTYLIWQGMRNRCNNSNNKDYFKYGKRGIKVCDRWSGKEGFTNFYYDIGIYRPSTQYSLDRIDNDKGYSPDNCRWATPKQQAANRRKLKSNTSGYIGVYHYKDGRKKMWVARIDMGRKLYNLGGADNPEEAAILYDRAVIFFRGEYGVTNIL